MIVTYILVVLNTTSNDLIFVEMPTPQTLYILLLVPDQDQAFQLLENFKPDYVLFEETFPISTGYQFSTFFHLQPGLDLTPIVVFTGIPQREIEKQSIHTTKQVTIAIPQWPSIVELIEMTFACSRTHLLSIFIGPARKTSALTDMEIQWRDYAGRDGTNGPFLGTTAIDA